MGPCADENHGLAPIALHKAATASSVSLESKQLSMLAGVPLAARWSRHTCRAGVPVPRSQTETPADDKAVTRSYRLYARLNRLLLHAYFTYMYMHMCMCTLRTCMHMCNLCMLMLPLTSPHAHVDVHMRIKYFMRARHARVRVYPSASHQKRRDDSFWTRSHTEPYE